MIEKKNSLQVMELIKNSAERVSSIEDSIKNVENKIESKLKIINTYNKYLNDMFDSINLLGSSIKNNKIVYALNRSSLVGGNYDIYGSTIHAAFVKLPENIFNFITETGPLYKDNATVKIIQNDEEQYKYNFCNILKHESDKTKEDVFHSFVDNTLTVSIEVNMGNLIGGTDFNIIEICPYLGGSFDITQIRLYTVEQYLTQDLTVPAKRITDCIKNVTPCRILLDKKYSLYKIEFDIQINYNDQGFPFGIRHIYFLNADMDRENAYVIAKISNDNYIASIGENIIETTIYSENRTNLHDKAVELYMFYDNNVLQNKISGPITRNIKEFFAKIPIYNESIALEFKEIKTR